MGNVELHLRSTDWFRHHHETDAAYNSVILHVVTEADGEVLTADGKHPPQLVLPIPEGVKANYAQLCRTEDYPRCWRIIPTVSRLTIHSWMSALLFERLSERADKCLERLDAVQGDWERAAFITLARNFGFGLNGDAFEQWARNLPLSACGKHRDDPFQLEAFFLGTAGLLQPEAIPTSAREAGVNDDYFRRLQTEYAYLAHKFELPMPMSYKTWRYLRLRPQNFPHLRLVQLAQLFHRDTAGFAALTRLTERAALHEAFETSASDYWQTHYLFGMPSRPNTKRLSEASRDLLIINTVVPLLFAHGIKTGDEGSQARAVSLLEQLKPEKNFIIRQWKQCPALTKRSACSTKTSRTPSPS